MEHHENGMAVQHYMPLGKNNTETFYKDSPYNEWIHYAVQKTSVVTGV